MTFPFSWRNPQHVAGKWVPLNNTRANWWDRSNAVAGLDVHRPWRKWQPHAEDLALSWKCKVRQVSIGLWWEISNGFWGFAFPFMFLSLSLSPSLFLSLPSSVLPLFFFFWFFFFAELSIRSPPLPVCALNSSHCSFEKQSHKTSFYAGPVSLMGLSLCTMLRSKPQELQTGMSTPTQTDRQTYGHIDPINDMVTVRSGARFGNSLGAVKTRNKESCGRKRFWHANILQEINVRIRPFYGLKLFSLKEKHVDIETAKTTPKCKLNVCLYAFIIKF